MLIVRVVLDQHRVRANVTDLKFADAPPTDSQEVMLRLTIVLREQLQMDMGASVGSRVCSLGSNSPAGW